MTSYAARRARPRRWYALLGALLAAVMLAGPLAAGAQDAPRPAPAPADTAAISELRSVVADVRAAAWAATLVPTARRVAAVLRGGEELALDDGTRWRVEPADRARAAAWVAGADVWFTRRLVPVIRDARERLGAEGSYDLVVLDAASGRAVAVRYAGRGTEDAGQ